MVASSSPAASIAILPIGSTFQGRYEVVRCIKAGGMGAVYEVIHLETKRRRALKVMLPSIVADPDMRARFKLEAQVAAEIESQHIVETFDAGIDALTGAPFLVMELLRGRDLAGELEARGRFTVGEALVLLQQAALALDKTHAAGIVHRDLKPENLFLTKRDDGSPHVKVLDFGIAKVVAQSAQTAKQTRSIGTPLFMSPEQINGDGSIGPRADLYALAHIAYALVAGEPYWQEDASQADTIYPLLMKVMKGAVEPPAARALRRKGAALPPSFDAWFARAANSDPKRRFESASALVAALGEALGSPSMSPAMPPTSALSGAGDRVSANPIAVEPTRLSNEGGTPRAGGDTARLPDPITASNPNAGGRTTSPIASDMAPAVAKSTKRTAPYIAVVMSASLLLGGVLLVKTLSTTSRNNVTSSGLASASAAIVAQAAMPPAPTATSAPTPLVTVAEKASAAAAPSASGAASASKSISAKQPATTTTPSKRTSAPPAKVDCTVPVIIDSAGHEIPKPGCM